MAVHEPGDPFVTLNWKFGMFVAYDSFYGYYTKAGTTMQNCIEAYGEQQAGAYSIPFATVFGSLEILRFWSYFSHAHDLDGAPTKVYYDVYDQTNAVAITLNGIDCTDTQIASMLGRIDKNTAVVHLMESKQVRIVDGAVGLELSAPFIVNAKSGANTRMRFNYTTDGTEAHFQVCHEVVWRPLSGSSYLSHYHVPT